MGPRSTCVINGEAERSIIKAEDIIGNIFSLSRYIPKTHIGKINKCVALEKEMKQMTLSVNAVYITTGRGTIPWDLKTSA